MLAPCGRWRPKPRAKGSRLSWLEAPGGLETVMLLDDCAGDDTPGFGGTFSDGVPCGMCPVALPLFR